MWSRWVSVQWIIMCAGPQSIQDASYDSTYKETTITLTGVSIPGGLKLDGKELRVAVPGDPDRPYRTARVQYAGGSSLTLWEPTIPGSDESTGAALDPAGSIGSGFVIYDSPSGTLEGRWSNVEYDISDGCGRR